jgi:hypothetical protein
MSQFKLFKGLEVVSMSRESVIGYRAYRGNISICEPRRGSGNAGEAG